jgi:hypothetical protein
MIEPGTNYIFSWEEILRFSDPEQKVLEGSELSPFVRDMGLIVMILHWYESALIDFRMTEASARQLAISQALDEMDVRSWDRFYEIKRYAERVIAKYRPDWGYAASEKVFTHMAEVAMPTRMFPKRWRHLRRFDA